MTKEELIAFAREVVEREDLPPIIIDQLDDEILDPLTELPDDVAREDIEFSLIASGDLIEIADDVEVPEPQNIEESDDAA